MAAAKAFMAPAKTARPTLRTTVLRRRLFRRLERTRGTRVTWVCGPPGAGKTALVSSHIGTRRLRSVWYQLDALDSDIASFFFHLRSAAPGRRRPDRFLARDYRQHSLAAFSRHFFREFYARLKLPF